MANFIDFTAQYADLVPARPIEHLGNTDLSFGGRIEPPLKIHEDGGEQGCGGKVWAAGELLCEYLIDKSDSDGFLSLSSQTLKAKGLYTNILELGSGTGLVGICAGFLARSRNIQARISTTDIDNLIELMSTNTKLNGLEKFVFPETLMWGEPLNPKFEADASNNIDLVLAADCVYLEAAFLLLEKTLLDLTEGEHPPTVLMSYTKRRKADKVFFRHIRKHFEVITVTDFDRYEHYKLKRTHLFHLVRLQ
ncbi:LAME_0G12640g1_1 [Lachancea meyersii CBS 8951]|uniref:LAME_0G12640g1_1 n=1 Tax=Lachancea meyersii CBS 8951 TaxID=1266667 RepID=A0A1G4K9P1_9SACH|nr:LAME_0G12640g1_1 [Lachancea meyersii CBS 8951]